ncbi:MAG: hypothetical protein QOD38_1594 [Acidimicrobiaceae bacterium]
MSRWLPRGRVLIFLVAVVVVGTVVGILVARNSDDKKPCVKTFIDFASDQDRPNSEAFAIFIAEQEESRLPLTGWSPTSETADESVYTSDVAGHWEVKVSRGAVREYSGCPS